MFARVLCLCCVGFLLACDLRADEPARKAGPIVKEIGAPRLTGIPRGNPRMPTEITSAAELTNVLGDKAGGVEGLKDVDFDKQKLIYFVWSGSGMDRIRLVLTEKEPKEVVFLYRPGRTKDLRGHVHLFVMDKKTKWRVADDKGEN